MRKVTPFLFCILLCAVAASANAESGQAKKFRIAVILPLSGQVASLGGFVRTGVELAYDQLSAAEKEKIELVFEDDQFDPTKTITAYRKLKSVGEINAVFTVASPPANALGPITERDQTLLMAIGASDPTIALGKEYSFIHWVIPPVLGAKLADELKRRDLKSIAFVTAEASGALADTAAAVAALKERGLESRIVYNQSFAISDTDFRSAISQLRSKKADSIVAVLFPGALASFAKQLRASGSSAELIGMETFENEAEVKAAAGALTGTWYVNASEASPEFIEAYRARYKEYPSSLASNGYDSVKLLAQAVTTVGNDTVKIRDWLRSVKDFHGASGVFSASGDNRFTLPAMLKRVTETGFEPLVNTAQVADAGREAEIAK